MRRCIWFVLLAVASGFAEPYKTCAVTMWTNETDLHASSRASILYFIRMGTGTYQVERPVPNVEMSAGERLGCRIDKGYMFIRNNKGKVNKAQIIESGLLQNQH